jgi:hypothetical protein
MLVLHYDTAAGIFVALRRSQTIPGPATAPTTFLLHG